MALCVLTIELPRGLTNEFLWLPFDNTEVYWFLGVKLVVLGRMSNLS
jgi:hypothetical protein